MTHHVDNASTGTPTSSDFPDYFRIVPIERGADKKKWKAPQSRGWNEDAIASKYPSTLYDGYNGGICHKQSETCAIDIDDLIKARAMFTARGIDLNRLLMSGCQISSGRDNRSKLLYKLPDEVIMLGAYPRTIQQADPEGMVFEFRCVSGRGKTMQDVAPTSIHPNGDHYKWVGYEHGIPEVPKEILQWWYELIPKRTVDAAGWTGVDDNFMDRAKVTKALQTLSPDLSYPEWRNVGVALHDTGWPDAVDIWHEWSSYGMDYDYDYCQDKWDDMSHGGGINITWLYAQAYREDANWERQAPELDSMPQEQPVTIDEGTGQVVQSLHTIISSITQESDANHMEWVCQNIAYYSTNRAEQADWLHHASDLSRYNMQTLGPMLSQARREMSRGRNTAGAVLDFPHLNDSDNPLPTRANAELVASTYGFQFKFNLMSRRVETERDLSHVPADVRELSHLTDFEDLCMQHRLDDKRVQKHRDRMAFDNSYHPFVDYLTQEKALGGPYGLNDEDELQKLFDSMILDGDMDKALAKTLLTRWLVSVVAGAHLKDEDDYEPWEDKPRAPRGVLVLQGDQNIGKTSWFSTITPDGMYKEGLQINQGDMNHMKTATNRLIVEIGEADHVTPGRMANYMKTIIGRSVDEVRLAFQKEEVRMVRRNVFCATVNPAEFLSDDQNTRWWTISITGINFIQLGTVNVKRLWQQVYALWLAGEAYHLTIDEMDTLNGNNEQYRVGSFFEQWLIDTYDWDDVVSCENKENWHDTKYLIGLYGTTIDVAPIELRSILKRLTGHENILSSINGVKGRFWKLPRRLDSVS